MMLPPLVGGTCNLLQSIASKFFGLMSTAKLLNEAAALEKICVNNILEACEAPKAKAPY
jgi:hypothetical protein